MDFFSSGILGGTSCNYNYDKVEIIRGESVGGIGGESGGELGGDQKQFKFRLNR